MLLFRETITCMPIQNGVVEQLGDPNLQFQNQKTLSTEMTDGNFCTVNKTHTQS